jgi:hypothetical protein
MTVVHEIMDRELIRQLSFTRVAFGPLRLDDPEPQR